VSLSKDKQTPLKQFEGNSKKLIRCSSNKDQDLPMFSKRNPLKSSNKSSVRNNYQSSWMESSSRNFRSIGQSS
jgi:hypothetical protein